MIFLGFFTIAQVGCHTLALVRLVTNLLLHVAEPVPCEIRATTAAWSIGMGLDILIAITAVRLLLQFDVAFKSTKSMIRKFLLCAVVSGGVTALCGVLFIALLVSERIEYVILATNFGKLYGITIFTNLVLIKGMQEQSRIILGTRDAISWFALPVSPTPAASGPEMNYKGLQPASLERVTMTSSAPSD